MKFSEFINENRKAEYYIKKDGFAKGKVIIVDVKTNTVVNDQEAETLISKFFDTKADAEKYWSSNPIGSSKKFNSKGFEKA